MQAPPPQPVRLHWIPVPASWLVAAGIVLLAVLPHQIPITGRRLLHSGPGAVLFAVASGWVTWKAPVLGIAMFMLLAGIWFHGPPLRGTTEGFADQWAGQLNPNDRAGREGFVGGSPILNKDRVKKDANKWLVEEVLQEQPKGIQDRTESPAISVDEIPDHDYRWEVENALDEHPMGIQERPVAAPMEYDEHQSTGPFGNH